MRARWLLFVGFLAGCGPDAQPRNCQAGPDFDVLITAEYGPLPSDTVIKLRYGGRPAEDPEVLTLAEPETPEALFCYVADSSGSYPKTEAALGSNGGSGAGGAAGEGGAGGELSPEHTASIDALFCQLWTDGSADLQVTSLMYGKVSLMLETQRGTCTIETKLELAPSDAGT